MQLRGGVTYYCNALYKGSFIKSWLSRCCTARRSRKGFFWFSPTKVQDCFYSSESSLTMKIMNPCLIYNFRLFLHLGAICCRHQSCEDKSKLTQFQSCVKYYYHLHSLGISALKFVFISYNLSIKDLSVFNTLFNLTKLTKRKTSSPLSP